MNNQTPQEEHETTFRNINTSSTLFFFTTTADSHYTTQGDN